MKIKEMFPDERPRERLRQRGARALSNTELLAVLLGSGTGGRSAMDVAQELISISEGRLTLLSTMPLERLMSLKGVGEVRALTLSAAIELGRRSFEENAILDKKSITSPKVAYSLMLPLLKGLDHEECWVIYLNRSNFILGKEMIHSGSLEMVLLDTGRILKKAIEKQCSYIILVHNHPNGDCMPSQADITQTDRLRGALRAVEITLLDHIVVAEDSFFSFSDDCRTVVG
ncbi:MAG: DNA repair protein RadC [Bacteroidales bacterium]|nr:DNA repair protein RadC [Bacteroidales bacterium]